MTSGSDKWIRSIKDNPAGKVVADPEGNRWQWESEEGTSHLLKKLNNDELAIEQTDIVPNPLARRGKTAAPPDAPQDTKARAPGLTKKPPSRDARGGFNPYDSSPKPGRRR